MACNFPLNLSGKVALTTTPKSKDNVLCMNSQSCDSCGRNAQLAATGSNYSIRLYSRMTLGLGDVIKGHDAKVTGLKFSNQNPNVLYSASQDKTVKGWDFRSSIEKPVQKFAGHEETNIQLTCLDLKIDDRILCAGTETNKDKDSFLIFWDSRKSNALGTYSESHENDITQVKFHPKRRNVLASGSTDGLVCLFDISQPCEDDALYGTLNSESSVAEIGWSGNQCQHIYCTTHIDTFHMWDSEEFDVLENYLEMREKLQDALTRDGEIDYLVNCFYDNDTDKLFLAAGSHRGKLYLFNIGDTGVSHVSSPERGHTDDVRCLSWDEKTQSLVTGGDDSMLCMWKEGSASTNEPSHKAKAPSSIKKRKKYMPI